MIISCNLSKAQQAKLKKIVISKGVGAAVADKKLIDHALDEITLISGQKAIATMSKKDISKAVSAISNYSSNEIYDLIKDL